MSATPASGWRFIGDIFFRFEAPDTVYTALAGDLNVADVVEVAAEVQRTVKGKPHYFAITDIRSLGSPSMEVRKAAIEIGRGLPNRGMAFFGGSLRMRVIPSLIAQAVNLFNRWGKQSPIRFFETEAEARAWIDERRSIVARERVLMDADKQPDSQPEQRAL